MRMSTNPRSGLFMHADRLRSGGRLILGLFLLAPLLAATCARAQAEPIPETLGVRLGIINYLSEGVAPVYINQGWAAGVRGHAYTSGTCCVSIPTQWKPGMTMRVEWRTDTMFERGEKQMVSRDAPILPFEPFHDGYIWAVFLPGGEVYLQPSAARPGAEGFLQGLPPPGQETAADLRRFVEKNPPQPAVAPPR